MAFGPVIERITVDHGIFVDSIRLGYEIRQVQPVVAPVLEPGHEIVGIGEPVPVTTVPALRCIEGQFRDPVDRGKTCLGICLRNRVGNNPLCPMTDHDHGGPGAEGLRLGRAAPEHRSAPLGRAFIWLDLRANGGMDAIGTDDQTALDSRFASVCR